jgi:hypothetical protein
MVLDYAQEQLEQWKHSMAICHQLVDWGAIGSIAIGFLKNEIS